MKPIVKWVGGKRQLLEQINMNIPQDGFNVYHEAFLGGAAVLIDLKPNNARINDLNKDLINVYNIVKRKPKKLIEILKIHQLNNSSEYFYQIRALDRNSYTYNLLDDINKAARILYLNKTCYNGLYRVNSSGHYNTPYGRYVNPTIADEENIKELSRYLNENKIEIFSQDFNEFLKPVSKGDFVYLDPPYDAEIDVESFTSYQASGFTRKEQLELKNRCDEIDSKGAFFLLSNADTKYIRELYKDYNIVEVFAKRYVNCKGDKRGAVKELLIRNYKVNSDD